MYYKQYSERSRMEANQISCSKCGGTSFTKDGETAKCDFCGAEYDIAQFRALSPEAEQRLLQIASDNLARLRELAEIKEARIRQSDKDETTPKRKIENADFLTDLKCSEEKRKQIEEEEKRRLIQEQKCRQEQINRIKKAADKRKREKDNQVTYEQRQEEAQIAYEDKQNKEIEENKVFLSVFGSLFFFQ